MKTVDFISAVNSGKRFRPLSFLDWIEVRDDYFFGDTGYVKTKIFYNCQFELEEKQITITEGRIDEILSLVTYAQESKDLIKRQLGF